MMKLHLTHPASIAAYAYLVMAIVILLPFKYSLTGEIPTKHKFSERLVYLISSIIPFALTIYSINCYMTGNCVIFSYLNAFSVILWVALVILSGLVYSRIKKADEDRKEKYVYEY
jgi:hypothetical protein